MSQASLRELCNLGGHLSTGAYDTRETLLQEGGSVRKRAMMQARIRELCKVGGHLSTSEYNPKETL